MELKEFKNYMITEIQKIPFKNVNGIAVASETTEIAPFPQCVYTINRGSSIQWWLKAIKNITDSQKIKKPFKFPKLKNGKQYDRKFIVELKDDAGSGNMYGEPCMIPIPSGKRQYRTVNFKLVKINEPCEFFTNGHFLVKNYFGNNNKFKFSDRTVDKKRIYEIFNSQINLNNECEIFESARMVTCGSIKTAIFTDGEIIVHFNSNYIDWLRSVEPNMSVFCDKINPVCGVLKIESDIVGILMPLRQYRKLEYEITDNR